MHSPWSSSSLINQSFTIKNYRKGKLQDAALDVLNYMSLSTQEVNACQILMFCYFLKICIFDIDLGIVVSIQTCVFGFINCIKSYVLLKTYIEDC